MSIHGKPASATTTTNGLYWYRGQKPSCHFFSFEEDCYLFQKAVACWKVSGCPHPVRHTHQRLVKTRMVKDKMKPSFGRPFFVCLERESPCSFWQWADIAESPKPICSHGLTCRVCKVKEEGPNQDRLFYYCPSRGNLLRTPYVFLILAVCSAIDRCISTRSQTRMKRLQAERWTL